MSVTPIRTSVPSTVPPPAHKSLALALRSNAAAVSQAASTYQTDVLAVTQFMATVLGSTLPTLNNQPSNWSDFLSAYGAASTDATDWTDSVLSHLTSIPASITTYQSTIDSLLTDAVKQANALVSNPKDGGASGLLSDDLTNLSSTFALISTLIEAAVKVVGNYENKLPGLATQLKNLATDATKASSADQAQITQLLADIATLQADISALHAAIIGLGVGIGVAAVIGIVATIVAFPIGMLAWFFVGAVIAAAAVGIAMDNTKIAADNAQIQGDQSSMTSLTADMATLNLVAQSYTQLADQTNSVTTDLTTVLSAWQALAADVTDAITDITDATADASKSNYKAVLGDLQNAQTEWVTVTAAIAPLTLSIQGSNASVANGQTSEQVAGAVSSAGTVDIISYLNLLSVN